MNVKKNLKITGINLTIALIAFTAYSYVESLFIFSSTQKLKLDRGFLIFATTIFTIAVFYAVYTWELSQYNNWDFNINLLSFAKSDWKKWSITLLSFVGMFLIQFLAVLILKGNSTNQQQWLTLAKSVNIPLLKTFLLLVAPIFEELIFRGLFFNALFFKKSKIDMIFGVIINGAIFALMHGLPNSWFYLVYWALGSILAANYLFTRDIRCNIVLHMINNALTML